MAKSFQTYPTELSVEEGKAIRLRRKLAGIPANDDGDGAMPDDTIGLALSGGGIRSATFCLGFLQALAQRKLLRHVDWLSTVSGGGYIGAFLGRFYDRLRHEQPAQATDRVEKAVANPISREVSWLRRHGEYIAPAGRTDLTVGLGIFLRNLLTVYLVVGLLLFGLYGLANGFRYGLLERIGGLLPFLNGFNWADMPLGRLIFRAELGYFWSPWFILVELVFLVLVAPKAVGYWLASQDEPEGYNHAALLVTFLVLTGLLYLGVRNGLNLPPLLAALPLVIAFWSAERTWATVRRDNAAVGTGGPKVQQLRARTRLSRDLGMWLGAALVLLYLGMIDTIGHAIYEAYGRGNTGFAKALAALMALWPMLRMAARAIANRQSTGKEAAGVFVRLLSHPFTAAVLAVLLMAPPLLAVSFLAHAAFGGGGDWVAEKRGWATTFAALVLAFILARRWALPFINRSSLQATYAARLARAYLGASNPMQRGNAADDVVPGDNVDTLTDYKPHEAGGPLHLINVCVNQTLDERTLRSARDRRGVAMACSAIGLSLDRFFHAFWDAGPSGPTIRPVNHVAGTAHPLIGLDRYRPATDPNHSDEGGFAPVKLDVLPLRDWVSISGAAFGPGMGKSTNPALSVLFVLANLRTGYWWDSGLTAGDRGTRPEVSFIRRLAWLLPKLFETQSQLFAEAFAHFRGPWDKYWYLSDGGHFENLGLYELIRRKVPVIVAVDSGADAGYAFSDLANLQRRVRVDFQAEIVPYGKQAWDAAVAKHVEELKGKKDVKDAWAAREAVIATDAGEGGPLDRFAGASASKGGAALKKHAALFRVVYPKGRPSVLLYVKASLTGDEPPDVFHYHVENPEFPHESTADQFFDEAQWESYRRLGEHVGDVVLGPEAVPAVAAGPAWLRALCPKQW